MRIVVVYKNPSDFPGMFVARAWNLAPGDAAFVPDDEPLQVTSSYDPLRGLFFAEGFTTIVREPRDDPAILEVWL